MKISLTDSWKCKVITVLDNCIKTAITYMVCIVETTDANMV